MYLIFLLMNTAVSGRLQRQGTSVDKDQPYYALIWRICSKLGCYSTYIHPTIHGYCSTSAFWQVLGWRKNDLLGCCFKIKTIIMAADFYLVLLYAPFSYIIERFEQCLASSSSDWSPLAPAWCETAARRFNWLCYAFWCVCGWLDGWKKEIPSSFFKNDWSLDTPILL